MNKVDIYLCDYVVAYIDLLGQRSAIPGRHLPDDKNQAIALVKQSVGRIIDTQKHFQKFFDTFTSQETIYSLFSSEMREHLPDMAPGELRWQRFSDGFVVYVPLGHGLIKSPVNSIFALLIAAGLHCLVGLASKAPVRIGIDVAWGIEYRPNEIYGAALAYSYHLESKIAQWPRIVIGSGLMDYLKHYQQTPRDDLSLQFRRVMAKQCLDLVATDTDGNWILDYLGQGFRKVSDGAFDYRVVSDARTFVETQITYWRAKGDQKLVSRYEQVANYIARNVNR